MNAPVTPLYRKAITARPNQPVLFETDNADILVFMQAGADGSITLTYEVHTKIPALKTCQRN